MAHASLRLLLSVALFSSCGKTLPLQVPGISNSAMTTKHIISTSKNESASPEETKLETTHIAPTLSPNISNVVLTQELLASNVPKFQNSEIEAAKKTLIRPTNIFLQSNLTIPLQSTNTTKLISPPLVPQVIFKTNVTNSTKSNTPLDETRFSVETPLNLSLVKASLPLKFKESSREATVKLIVAPVNIFMSNQIYLQSTESSSVVPKLMVKTNNVTSINYTTTPSMVNVSPSHDESQNISFLSVLSNNTILTPIKDSPLSNSESYNATLTSISTKTSASSIFLSPPVTLSHTKAPINNGNSSFNSHGNETNDLIGNTKGSNRKRRLRGRQSTKTEHKVVKNCNQCEMCKRDKPICAKPVGVDGGDNQLRGFPSMCHLDCSNNCRKIHYEKVADGRCGRLRNWFQPLGSVSRLNRVELGKLEYQLTPGSTHEYAFLPLS